MLSTSLSVSGNATDLFVRTLERVKKPWPLETARARDRRGRLLRDGLHAADHVPRHGPIRPLDGRHRAAHRHPGALPLGLVCMQLLSAVVVQHLSRAQAAVDDRVDRAADDLPARGAGPWLFPQVDGAVWVWMLIGLTALNHGLLHFGTPLWLSWMGDYLPHKGLNHFWGVRHSSQQWTAALALLANALCFVRSGADVPRRPSPTIIVLGVVLGVTDILLFTRIEEPPMRRVAGATSRRPRPGRFASAIIVGSSSTRASGTWRRWSARRSSACTCWNTWAWTCFDVLMLWTISWVGGRAVQSRWANWAERFGQRPVLILCTAFKSINMFGLLLCPADPTIAFYLLAPIFMIDAFLNAGIAIANNGFMIKNSPRENRTMFVAAGAGFAGIVGGAASIAAGGADRQTPAGRARSAAPSTSTFTCCSA